MKTRQAKVQTKIRPVVVSKSIRDPKTSVHPNNRQWVLKVSKLNIEDS